LIYGLIVVYIYLQQGEAVQRCHKTQLMSENTKEIDNKTYLYT